MGRIGASAFHYGGEAVGEFADAVCLAELDGLVGDQGFADAKSGGAGADEVAGGVLIHSAGGDQGDVREGRFQGVDIVGAADLRAREDFHEVAAGAPGLHDFGGR